MNFSERKVGIIAVTREFSAEITTSSVSKLIQPHNGGSHEST